MVLRGNLRLVSFDGGGGARTFSQLRIMGQIMHQLSCERYPEQSDKIMLPCEHFDLMGGSGTGGLIAIMFARLRMSVEEASDEFFTIVEEVYKPENLAPSERTQRLRECIEDVMNRKGLPVNLKLMGNIQSGHCASFVVASPRTNATNKVCLRTYPLRNQLPSTITLIEAVMATCAVQPTFSSVTSGSSYNKKEYIGPSFGAANPVREVITEARSLFGGDSGIASLLSLGAGHPGVISFPSSREVGLHSLIRDMMSDCEQRAQEIERQIGRVGVYFRFSVEQGMQSNHLGPVVDPSEVVAQTENFIADHKTSEQIDRFLRNFDTATRLITLDQLEYAGGANIAIQAPPTLESALAALESNWDSDILAKLKVADLESHPHIAECMEGTRQDILERINTWMLNLDAPNILWLKGHPGVGKSAIASSVVERLRAVERLGSHFFFQRQRANVMTTHALWRTVAYDLARRYPSIRKCLLATLSADETIPTISNVDKLFLHLIQEPVLAGEEIPSGRSPIVVVDAVDECGGLDGQHSEVRRSLMRTLKSWSGLPSRFKLIVTSRVESDIERALSRTNHHSIEILTGQRVESRSLEDIEKFLAFEFQQIAVGYHRSLSSGWPGTLTIKKLSARAAGLFIWAKTVIKFIALGEPQRRLSHVLEGGGTGDIGSIYSQILNTSFLEPIEEDIRNFHTVVGTIILAKAPLSFSTLTDLLSMETSVVEHICNGLESVLESRGLLQFHHQSFVDFLVDPSRSASKFYIICQRESRFLTQACLRVMDETLGFNICRLESSHFLNVNVLDLSSREKQHIPPHLSYSCSWWASHLAETEFDDEIFRNLQNFIQKQFLFWLEVLSIIKGVNLASRALLLLSNWILPHGQEDALTMTRDMQKFVAVFASVISQSAPHIYLSALPFAPQSSAISKQYRHAYKILTVQTGGLHHWPAFHNILNGHTSSVMSVAFSPDGRRIVSGSSDNTIRLWDAETGETVTEPLKGHTSSVYSVAFSPDGRRIASGSGDNTIQVWDAQTGEIMVGPLKGHTETVYCVAFSPDGQRIASGSWDNTIRMWNAETGEMVVEPFKGHTDAIYCVAFSKDGHGIVSGSSDKTVVVWDAQTGDMIARPLRHTSTVYSVAFSADGRIVSGSWDNNVHIWNPETGKVVVGPLKGHTDSVTSIALSPGGRRIVSGSKDHTIRVWDTETGKLVAGPLRGHTDSVMSVVFSPDGYRILSGSGDKSIWVWDTETYEAEATEHSKVHTDSVMSVVFSPGGCHIASGSSDNTIRLWDSKTGLAAVAPLNGHADTVYSVAFSPDGSRIVSGFGDKKIRVWDTMTGEVLVGPLKGHRSSVFSVAISRDGRRIISGSGDKMIRVWDAETGEVLVGPLKGHTSSVMSVAFSPDGRRIVSGSADKTIRLWNVETGEVVMGPLKGHRSSVYSVTFSPDGHRVASGSGDNTIRLWNSETDDLVMDPLKAHTDSVMAVAFSPGGHRIVSGSSDRTIYVWDAETGEAVAGPLKGHIDSVMSVAFSPDGQCIVSGSSDKTIRVQSAIGTGSKVRYSTLPVCGLWLNQPLLIAIKEVEEMSKSFTDSSTMKDGWMLGSNSELLFWVPPTLQAGLLRPGSMLLIGKPIATRLDVTSFVHGESWSLCKI